jgi:hypothetical protein
MFDSYDGGTGASITLTGLAITDVEIYKGTSMTQRASDAGVVLLDTDGIDIDGVTGIHGFSIDTGDNTDAGFYAVGSFFTVVVSAVTIDAQTVNFVAGTFRLLAAEAIAGKPKADVDAWLGTAAATPTVAGVPEVDLTHVAGATTNVSTIATSVQTIVGVTAAVIADAVLDEDMTAHQTQGSLGQAIGDPVADANTIYGAVVTAAAGATVAADIIAVKAETASILTDTAEIGAAGAGLTNIGTIATVTTLTNKTGFSLAATGLDAVGAAATGVQAIVDAIWDEDVDAGHQTAGTSGKKLDDAGAAADPWATAIPGAYGAGTAGSRLGKLPDVTAGAAGGVFIAGANAATSITTALTANVIGNVTGNLSGSVGSVTGAVGSVTGAVGSVTGAVGSVTGAVGSVTGAVGSVAGNVDGNVTGTVAGVTPSTAAQVAAVLTTAITESYRANGAAPTLAQFMSEVIAHLGESAISGTTKTISKFDHVTAAETFTLDDATTPSSITRAT